MNLIQAARRQFVGQKEKPARDCGVRGEYTEGRATTTCPFKKGGESKVGTLYCNDSPTCRRRRPPKTKGSCLNIKAEEKNFNLALLGFRNVAG